MGEIKDITAHSRIIYYVSQIGTYVGGDMWLWDIYKRSAYFNIHIELIWEI